MGTLHGDIKGMANRNSTEWAGNVSGNSNSQPIGNDVLYELLYEHTGTINGFFDVNGLLLTYNKTFLQFFDENLEYLISGTKGELTNKAQYEMLQFRIKETLSLNKVMTYFSEFINKDAMLYLESTYVPVYNNGEVKGVHIISRDITPQRMAEKVLLQNEENYRILFEQSTLGVLLTGSDQKVVLANERIEDITGYTISEIIGKDISMLFDKESLEKYPLRIKDMGDEETVLKERKLKKKDGSFCIAELRSRKLPDGRIQILITDISIRKRWEEKLTESEDRYRKLFEMLSDPVFLIDKDTGQVLESNSAVEEIYGYTKHESVRMKNTDFSAEPNETQKALQERVPKVLLRWHKKKSGEIFPVEITGSNFNWKGNDVQIAVCRDISERIAAEKSLKEFERIFNISANPISISNFEGNFIKLNPAFEKILGFSFNEMENKPVLDFVHPDDQVSTMDYITQAMQEQRELLEFENRYLSKDGKEVWFSWKTMAVYEEGIAFSVAHDITRLKDIEQELIKAKEKAEESDRLKTAFLCNMSHEIRTPMNGIVGFADILTQPDIERDKRVYIADIINQSCQRLLHIINDIIDISKIETGQLSYDITTFDIHEMLNNIFGFYITQVNNKGLELSLNCQANEVLMVRADKIKVRQVFDNLLTNAMKFTKEGHITVGYTIAHDQVCCFVSDSGDGIPEEYLNSIFKRFIQADDDLERKHSGTGLGLPICQAFVQAMGGDIWVDSVVGKGSDFKFTLSLAVD